MPANESLKAALALIEKDKSKVLGATVGKEILEPGKFIPRSGAQEQPTSLSYGGLDPAKTYMVLCFDVMAPWPSLNLMGPILHWMQPGFKVSAGSSDLTTSDPFVADYVGPGPPPGSSPHQYVFLLYEQPAGYDAKAHAPANGAKMGVMGRMRYSLDNWEKETKAGPVIAANYFMSN